MLVSVMKYVSVFFARAAFQLEAVSLEVHFTKSKRYKVKEKKKKDGGIILFLKLLHTGDERLEQINFGRHLK